MKKLRGQVLMGSLLIILSLGLYLLQVRLFHDERNTFFYLFQDLAFVPIQILLVTVIVDQVLRIREKAAMMNKLNMVIGAFFSEAGVGLLKGFSSFDHRFESIREDLVVTRDWTDREFASAVRELQRSEFRIDSARGDLAVLKQFLAGKREFLLGLLANPNLLEHETFTELLWAVFHLTEELMMREDVTQLPAADAEHIAGDIRRAYILLIVEWLVFMKHLKNEYPYLFSLALRTSPFDRKAAVTIP